MTRTRKFLIGLASVFLVLSLAYLFRSDPIMMISGKGLSGEEFPYPDDWRFSDSDLTVAVETRIDDPHSVTTLAFVHEGQLHIPAQSGSSKRWPQYVLADPRIRIKTAGKIFRARAERVEPLDIRDYRDSLALKYSEMADRAPEDLPPDIWLFRILPPEN